MAGLVKVVVFVYMKTGVRARKKNRAGLLTILSIKTCVPNLSRSFADFTSLFFSFEFVRFLSSTIRVVESQSAV